MNFIIEYYIKVIEFFFEENELNLNNKNILLYIKYIYKIIIQKLIFDINL